MQQVIGLLLSTSTLPSGSINSNRIRIILKSHHNPPRRLVNLILLRGIRALKGRNGPVNQRHLTNAGYAWVFLECFGYRLHTIWRREDLGRTEKINE